MTSLTWTFPNNLQPHRRKEGWTPWLPTGCCSVSIQSQAYSVFLWNVSRQIARHRQCKSMTPCSDSSYAIRLFVSAQVPSTKAKLPLCKTWRHMAGEGIAPCIPCICNLNARCRCVVSFMPQSTLHPAKHCLSQQIRGWLHPRTCHNILKKRNISCPCWESNRNSLVNKTHGLVTTPTIQYQIQPTPKSEHIKNSDCHRTQDHTYQMFSVNN